MEHRFDRISKVLASGQSRRRFLQVLGGGLLGTLGIGKASALSTRVVMVTTNPNKPVRNFVSSYPERTGATYYHERTGNFASRSSIRLEVRSA
jgi:hypothetical protein